MAPVLARDVWPQNKPSTLPRHSKKTKGGRTKLDRSEVECMRASDALAEQKVRAVQPGPRGGGELCQAHPAHLLLASDPCPAHDQGPESPRYDGTTKACLVEREEKRPPDD